MDFRILGPLDATADGRSCDLGGAKQQVLLGTLLLHANRVVPVARLVDELWGEAPPASAPKLIQGYVGALRRALGRDAIDTRAGGYLLHVEPDRFDLTRFQSLTAAARACRDDPAAAAERFEQALALWRGGPLQGVAFRSGARAELRRLEEQRMIVLEERIDADLALGRHAALVGELSELVARHPFRERLRGQLMLALYRSGRQAEALEAYRVGRRVLTDELGLEPGAALRDLEQRILRQDPELCPAGLAARALAPAVEAPAPRAASSRRRAALAAAVATAITVAVAVALLSRDDGARRSAGRLAGNSVAIFEPEHGRLVADVALGTAPGDIAVDGDSAWVANPNEGTVTRIDVETRTIRQTLRVRKGPAAIAVGAGTVWVANGLDGTVSRIDPEANRVVQTIRVGNGPTGVAVGEGSAWVVNRDDHTVSRIDPRAGRVVATAPVGGDPVDAAAGAGAVWVTSRSAGEVLKLDPATTRVVDAVGVGRGPGAVAVAGGAVWVANSLDGTVSRIDPAAAAVRSTISVGEGPSTLGAGSGAIWVGHEADGALWRIDVADGSAARHVRAGAPPAGIAVGSGHVFVSALPAGGPHRGGTLRVLLSTPAIESLDPAAAYDALSWAVLGLTHDGLTAFKRVSGTAGAELVPNLAVSIPRPADGGRTYTFRLRPGIHYASGARVRPSDFRRALERVFASRSRAAPLYAALTGSPACVRRPQRCDLSRGVVADDRAGTVRFHLTEHDPELLDKLALPPAAPAPARAPRRGRPERPLGGTAAYMVASHVPRRQLRLVRNPRFHEWSRAARPDGYADEIVIEFGSSWRRQARAVSSGIADVAYFPPPERLLPLRPRHTSRMHSNPGPTLWYVSLNTHVAPFDDVRVRRALNLAVDRPALVRLLGGAFAGRPTCQVIPAGFPGHRPYCPYRHDLARARRLVATSGTRGARVAVWTDPVALPLTRPVVSALRALGYRAHARVVGKHEPWLNALPRRVVVQAAQEAWVADYPAASTMVRPFMCETRPANLPSFCDRGVERAIARAVDLELREPQAARRAWEAIDRRLVDKAAAVPLVNPRRIDFLSARAGNYQYHPLWGMLLDQLWVVSPR